MRASLALGPAGCGSLARVPVSLRVPDVVGYARVNGLVVVGEGVLGALGASLAVGGRELLRAAVAVEVPVGVGPDELAWARSAAALPAGVAAVAASSREAMSVGVAARLPGQGRGVVHAHAVPFLREYARVNG